MWIAPSLDRALTPIAAALGNFDGIHRGHQQVIQPVLQWPAWGAAAVKTVVTFTPHPQEFFSKQPRSLLTPLDEKVRLLDRMGVEQLVLLPFTPVLAQLPPKDFVDEILIQGLSCQHISVGQDFCFGQRRSGTVEDLVALAAIHGVEVDVVPLKQLEGSRISSSRIREALLAGEVAIANRLLGRAYRLQGRVEPGQQLGRKLGFPTANVQTPAQKFLPRHGVYAVEVSSLAVPGLERPRPGVMNIGDRPTVEGQRVTVEVHLLDWQGDLYGKGLTVELLEFLRPQQKFDGIDQLKAQITRDCDLARSQLRGDRSAQPQLF